MYDGGHVREIASSSRVRREVVQRIPHLYGRYDLVRQHCGIGYTRVQWRHDDAAFCQRVLAKLWRAEAAHDTITRNAKRRPRIANAAAPSLTIEPAIPREQNSALAAPTVAPRATRSPHRR
jgi:hypothetical protein